MKQWLSIFSAVLLAVVLAVVGLVAWQRWVARWDAEAVKLMEHTAKNIAGGREAMRALPDPQAIDYTGSYLWRLAEVSVPEMRRHLVTIPPGATMEKDLRAAEAAGNAMVIDLRAELAKPGNAFPGAKVKR